ncbi:MAG: glycosyltransferase [Planctomycetaceae bacterium]
MLDLTIVIPQRGRTELTLSCLESLRAKEEEQWPVVVVDDGSSTEEIQRFQELKPSGVRLITQQPRGVTSAWNLGVTQVSTEMVLFLNNDVLFRDASIEGFLKPLRDNTARITGVKYRQGSLPVLEGWAFACRTSYFYQVGGFDSQFELYYSDTDFQLRILEEFGAGSLQVGETICLQHLGHQTAHREVGHRAIWRRDRALFRQKWSGREQSEVDAAVIASL